MRLLTTRRAVALAGLFVAVTACGSGGPEPKLPPDPPPPATAAAAADPPELDASQTAPAGGPAFVLQAGHDSDVKAVAWGPGGDVLGSLDAAGNLKVWDMRRGLLRLSVSAGKSGKALAFPDAGVLAVSDVTGTPPLVDLRTGAVRPALDAPDAQRSAISRSGQVVALARGGGIEVRDVRSNRVSARIEARLQLDAFAVSPDGSAVAAGSPDKKARIWDAKTGALRATLEEFEPIYAKIAFSPDGSALAVSHGDAGKPGSAAVRIWDARTGALRLEIKSDSLSNSLAWSPDGRTLYSGQGGTVKAWEAATGAATWKGGVGDGGGTQCLAVSPDGSTLAAGGYDGGVRLLDARTGKPARALQRHSSSVARVAWSPDGSTLAAAITDITNRTEARIVLWDVRAGVPRALLVGHGKTPITGIGFSGDGATLASADFVYGKTVRVWDVRAGTQRQVLKAPEIDAANSGGYKSVAVSPDGSRVAAGATDKSIKVWDARSGALLQSLPRRCEAALLAFSADGSTLASACPLDYAERTVELVDTRSWTVRATIRQDQRDVQALAWSPDGATIATSDGLDVLLRDARSGAVKTTLAQTGVRSLAFTGDGTALCAGGVDGTKLWDLAAGRPRARFKGFVGCALSPDGRVTASAGATVRLHRFSDGASVSLEAFGPDAPTGWKIESDPKAVASAWHLHGLAHTNGGLFAGDDEAFKRVVFRLGDDARTADLVTADDLFDAFHRPGLVADLLDGKPLARGGAAAAAKPAQEVGRAPEVAFAPAPPPTTTAERLSVRVKATDRGGGVAEIRVFVNGARADAGRALELEGGSGAPAASAALEKAVEVVLTPGDNEIVVEAYSAKGRVRSPQARARITREGAAPVRPDLHVLAMTLDEYDDPSLALSFANADGAAVVKALEAQKGKLYGDVRVTRLRDRDATREGLERAIGEIAKVAKTTDVFVFYAAGHGTVLQCPADPAPRYYLVTYKASLRSQETICANSVHDERLGALVRSIPARKKLIVLDTCHAGAAATGQMLVAMRSGEQDIDAIKRLARAEGLAVVAAAAAKEYAGEIPALGHGVFTYALLEGLKGSAARSNPVTVYGLLGYLSTEVPALSARHFKRSQYPITSTQGEDFPISLP